MWNKLKYWYAQFFSAGAAAQAPLIPVETLRYAEKEGELLHLDWYAPQGADQKTAVLFMHGGGFSEGTRDDPRYAQFARQLAARGFGTASISYRLTMRGRSFGCDQPAEQKIYTFRCAAEDAWDATRFLLSEVCPDSRIVLCGSSAGAEAVLHAAYWPDPLLPTGFRYAGVIGMAAAVLHLDWITSESAVPSLLFHGVDDPLVPFGSASHHYCDEQQPGFLMLHGSGSIARRLEALHKPVVLIKGDSGGHGWADKPMFEYVDRILSFLEREIDGV